MSVSSLAGTQFTGTQFTGTQFTGMQSGTFVSTRGGPETFTRSIANQNGTRTADTTFTLADGKTVTRDAAFTQTATGWTRDITTTLADGKTTTLQETGTKQADGSTAVTGTFTDQNGQTQAVAGTDSRAAGKGTSDLTFTNAAGQTRTTDAQTVASGDQVLRTVQGTNFGGATFSGGSALAILQSQAAPAS